MREACTAHGEDDAIQILVLLLGLAVAACASGPQPSRPANEAAQPPVARKLPHVTQIDGDALQDDYYWLRDKGTPEVESYLRAEAAYADAMMKPTEALQRLQTPSNRIRGAWVPGMKCIIPVLVL